MTAHQFSLEGAVVATERPSHPAKYSDELLPVLAKLLRGRHELLDPMAGTGKIAAIRRFNFDGHITCNDLEPEWTDPAFRVDEWHFSDAASMDWANDGQLDAICTSPTYGNRMADHHEAQDGSRRYSYTHCLGHALHEGNTGQMQWGEAYRTKHVEIVRECRRVLKDIGVLVVNVSNHVRHGEIVDVVGWWRTIVPMLGFEFITEYEVPTKRMRNGANAEKRVDSESVLVFERR
jgi:hypothetical protein